MTRLTISIDDNSMLSSQEEEVAGIKYQFLYECGDVFDFKEHDVRRLTTAGQTDVWVIDFGGLGLGFNSTGVQRITADLMRLVEDRPGTLFCLWSAHTEAWYKSEMRAALPDEMQDNFDENNLGPNVLLYGARAGEEAMWDKIRGWIGVKARPEETPELTAKLDEFNDLSMKSTRALARASYEEPEEVEEVEAEVPVPNIDDVCLMEEIEESAAELNRKRQKAERAARREKRRQEGTDNEFHADVPKEPDGGPTYGDIVGELRVPIRIEMRPGLTKGFMKFKFADCIVDVSNDGPDGKEIHVAAIGGQMGGSYEASFDEVEGQSPRMSYMLATQDLWKAWEAFHAQYTKEHPELMTYKEQGFSGAVKVL